MNAGTLSAFAPFIAFAIADRFASPVVALAAGAIVSIALATYGSLVKKVSPRVMEAASVVLFSALTIYALVVGPTWSVFMVRLLVDASLLAVIVLSIIIGQPFTLQYARERAPREFWNSPVFLRINNVITWVWALAFAVIVVVDYIMTLLPTLHPALAFIVIVGAIYAAYKFTVWYPERAEKLG